MEILKLLAEKPLLTHVEIAAKVGLSENGVKKILANLKTAGWLERQGSNKSGH